MSTVSSSSSSFGSQTWAVRPSSQTVYNRLPDFFPHTLEKSVVEQPISLHPVNSPASASNTPYTPLQKSYLERTPVESSLLEDEDAAAQKTEALNLRK